VRPPILLNEGDVVRLKKPHPCGTNAWEIMRLGMDVKLRCTGCGHIVRLERARLERRVREVLGQVGEGS
jgi:hypothetical protein